MGIDKLFPESNAEAARQRKERDQSIRIQTRNLERSNSDAAKATRKLKELMGMDR